MIWIVCYLSAGHECATSFGPAAHSRQRRMETHESTIILILKKMERKLFNRFQRGLPASLLLLNKLSQTKLMRTLIIVLCICIFDSCLSINKATTNDCNENLEFKQKFFANISLIEKYTKEQKTFTRYPITTDSVMKSMKFIYMRTKILSDEIYNYNFGYKSYKLFEIDKRKWLNWYNANKCNNLQ